MLLLAESSFAIDVQQDKRAALGDWHLGCSCFIPQRTNTDTASGTTHMLRGTIRINRNVFSFSLCEKEKSKKTFLECCCLPNRRLQLTSSKTNALRWVTGILAVVASYQKGQTLPPASGTTHMLRGTIRINRSVLAVLFVPDFCQVLGADDATYSEVDNVSKCLVAF